MLSKYMYSVSTLPFAKGPKQPPEPTRVSDNLRSEDTVEVLLGLGEGPWSKLHDGMKSFYIANTPLMASDGTLNFPDAQLIFHKGTQMPDPIKFLLGGSASGHSVGVNLAQNAPVTRTTTSGDIDAIDVRIRIDQLMRNTTDGDQLNEDLLFRIEVKPTSSGTWQTLPSNTGWLQSYTHPDPVDSGSGIFGTLRSRIEELRIEQGFTQFQAEAQAWAEYQDNADGPIDTSLGVTAYSDNVRVYGRTQSPVMKEIRIPVARLTTDTYDIRVTKISAESTSTSIRELTWDTFEQITIEEKSYPNTAMAQLIVKASDQLSNIPQMYGIYDTAEVLVPTIFDPVTRSYDFTGGPWDGTFKKVFTDDLAWIIYDLVHNDVHGIAAYHTINFSRYEALEASLYWNACDEVTGAYVGVPRPNGGTRPRVTFNGSITTPRNSMELLTYMAGAGNAVFYEDVEGNFRLRVERNTTATHTFNNMDIENGRFQYSFSDINTRYNDITVVYRNKLLPAYQEDRRRVFDQADIDLHGRKPLTFVAVGCVDTDEAINRAYHKLVTSLTETRNVAFTTTRLGAYVEPHDIILIADEAMDEGHSRRCMDISSDRRTLTYNEPLVLESGVTDYKVRIQTANGIWETNVIWGSVATTPTTVRLEDALPTDLGLDPNFSFSVASATEGDLRPYRVIGIEEGDDANEKIKITALEVNRSKYALVDNFDGTVFDVSDEPDISSPDSTAVLELTANVLERVTSDGKVNDINLTWEAPSTAIAGGKYSVKYTFNDGQSREIFRGSAQQFSMAAVDAGTHLFAVNALNVDGSESPQIVRTRVTTVAPFYGLPSITGVTIQNKKDSDTTYIGRNVSLEWSVDTTEKWEGWASDKPHPDFAWFEVDVVDPTNGSIVHTYQVADWKNKKLEIPYSDFNGFGLTDIRNFSVVVSVSDAEGNEGSTFTRSVQKPVITLANVAFNVPQNGSTRGTMVFDDVSDTDYRGVKVWVSQSSSANTSGSLQWNRDGTPILTFEDGTNYVAYQVLDVFGNQSSPIIEVTYEANIVTTQEIVTGLVSDIEADIQALQDTYGDTQSAADSAAAALISENNSANNASSTLAARDAAQLAQTQVADAEARIDAKEIIINNSAAEVVQDVLESRAIQLDIIDADLDPYMSDPENSLYYFQGSNGSGIYTGDEATVRAHPNYINPTSLTGVAGARGKVAVVQGNYWLYTTKVIPVDPTRKYELAFRVKQHIADANVNNNRIYAGLVTLDDSLNAITGGSGTHRYFAANNALLSGTDFQDFTGIIEGVGDGVTQFRAGTAFVRLMFIVNHNGGTGTAYIDSLKFDDVTNRQASEASAIASADSLTAVLATQTAVGQTADVVEQDRLAAQTARADAEAARDTTVSARDTTTAAEANVTTLHQQVVNLESDAQGHAAATAADVTTTSGHVTDSQNFANASQAASLTATTRRDEAETFRNQSAAEAAASLSSANSASASQTSAAQEAQTASNERALAQTARGGAETAQAAAVVARNGAEGFSLSAATSAQLSASTRLATLDISGDPYMKSPDESLVFFKGGSGAYAESEETIRDHPSAFSPIASDTVAGARGRVGVIDSTQRAWVYSTKFYPVDTSRRYKAIMRFKQVTMNGGQYRTYLGLATYDSAGNVLSSGVGTHRYLGGSAAANGAWETREGIITGEGDTSHNEFRPNTAFVRLVAIFNDPDGSGQAVIDELRLEDITAQFEADASATIAQQSAVQTTSDVATTLTNVNQTSTFRAAAEAARDLSQGYANTAATARDAASGHATVANNAATSASADAASAANNVTLSASLLLDTIRQNQDPLMVNTDLLWYKGSGSGTLIHKRPSSTANGGYVMASNGFTTALADEYIPVDTTKKYKIRVRARQSIDNGTAKIIYAGLDCFDENKARISGSGGTYLYSATAGGQTLTSTWTDYENVVTGQGNSYFTFRTGTKFVRRILLLNYLDGTGEAEVDVCEFYEATAELNAASDAAIASANAVQTTADAASTASDRTAASNFRNEALAFRNTASTAASNASNDATSASASAASASQNNTLTAQYRDDVRLDRAKQLPSTFENGRDDFQSSYYAPPAITNTPEAAWVFNLESGTPTLRIANISAQGFEHLTHKGGGFVPEIGRKYRLRVTFMLGAVAPTHSSIFSFGFLLTDANYVYQAGQTRGWTNSPAAGLPLGQWITVESNIAEPLAGDDGFRAALELSGQHSTNTAFAIREFKIIDVTEREDAASSATIANQQAVIASNEAAAAASERTLTASIRKSTLNLIGDPTMKYADESFVYYVNSGGSYGDSEETILDRPTALTPVVTSSAGSRGSVASITSNAQTWGYTVAMFPVDPTKRYKIRGRVKQHSRTSGNTKFYTGIVTYDANKQLITGGAGTHRYQGLVNFNPVVGQWYDFEGFFEGEGDTHDNFRPNTAFVRLLVIGNYVDGVGEFHIDELRLVEAEAVELEASVSTNETAIANESSARAALAQTVSTMNSQVSTLSATFLDAQGNVGAYWTQETGVTGFSGTFISARTTLANGVVDSNVSFGAREIGLYNSVGGTWLQAMRVSGGDVRISGNLEAGAGIYLGTGSGRWPVALQQRVYNETDGTVITFGTNVDIGDYEVDFSPIGLDELASGEAYRLRAINKTGTGFTAELKITTTGATVAVTENTNATSPTGPQQMVAKADTEAAYNDNYVFYISGTVDVFGFDEFEGGGGFVEYWGQVQVETWFHDGTSWVQGPNKTLSHYQLGINPNHGEGNQSYSFSNKAFSVNYTGTIRTSATLGSFGATETSGGSLTNLNKVTYTKQGSSGTRSATPNGELCKITVKPENQSTA